MPVSIDGVMYIRVGRCTGIPLGPEDHWNGLSKNEQRDLAVISWAFAVYNAIHNSKGMVIN